MTIDSPDILVRRILLVGLGIALGVADPSSAAVPPQNVQDFFQKHCIECHGAKEHKGDIRLDTLEAVFGEKAVADAWLEVMDAINKGDMPPKKVKVRPASNEFEPVTGWIAEQLRAADAARRSTGGHVVLRRLNKTEYRNTVRDLFGFTELPLFDLPDDTPMNGFYNIGAALTVSPSHLEQYLAASQKILDKGIVTGDRPADASVTLTGAALSSDQEAAKKRGPSAGPIYNTVYAIKDGAAHLYQSGLQFRRFAIPTEGEYLVQIRVSRTDGFKANPQFSIGDKKGGAVVLQGEVTTLPDKPGTFERRLTLRPGELSFTFNWDEGAKNLKKAEEVPAGTPALVFHDFAIKGPLFETWPPPSHQRLFYRGDAAVKDAAYAKELLARFVARMYRRPLQPEELARLMELFEAEVKGGASFEHAVKFSLQYALCSSPFLYLFEGDSVAAAKVLGGEFDAATGMVTVKKNKTSDVTALLQLSADPTVKGITLDGCSLKSDGVAALAKSKSLTALKMEHTMVNKVPDLKVLAGIPTLEELNLGGSDFGDEGLRAVCELKNLRVLALGHVGRSDKTSFTADGLKALGNLPRLESLILHLNKPDHAMIPVLASLKTVKDLKVGGVSSDYLKKLQAAMPQAKVASRGPTTDTAK